MLVLDGFRMFAGHFQAVNDWIARRADNILSSATVGIVLQGLGPAAKEPQIRVTSPKADPRPDVQPKARSIHQHHQAGDVCIVDGSMDNTNTHQTLADRNTI